MKKQLFVSLVLSFLMSTQFYAQSGQRSEYPLQNWNNAVQPNVIKFGGFIGDPGNHPTGEMTNTVSNERIHKECTFYGGDTLKGFDFEATISEYKRLNLYFEFRNAMHRAQDEFVKKKFKIAELPHEHGLKHFEPDQILASTCSNLDFEDGNFGSWTVSSGYNSNSNANLNIPAAGAGAGVTGTNTAWNSCTDASIITSAYGNDPAGGFPGLCPTGGTYSTRLGTQDMNTAYGYGFACDGYKWDYEWSNGEVLEQTFVVTASNALVSYNYAIILNDAGSSHLNGEQPYFHVYIKNSSGTVLSTCTQYSVQATGGSAPAGFSLSGTKSNPNDGTPYYYKGWTNNSINLTPYIGQTVNIEFVTAGCVYGAHTAWAYVDVTCGPAVINASNANPCSGTTSTLTAPAVAGGSYAWSGPAGGISGSTTGQSVNVTQSGTYTVTVTPSQGASCSYTLTKAITFQAAPTTSVNSATICSGGSASLTASGADTYSWNTGSTSNPYSVSPGTTTTYTVTGTLSSTGCTSQAVTTVTVNPTPTVTAVSSPTTICQGSSATLTGSSAASNVTFSNTSGYSIPDNNAGGVSSPITVSGLPGTVGTSLVSVNVNITHPNDGDLTLQLVCPGAASINLSASHGGIGDNYTSTTFTVSGGTAIGSGSAPFTGIYAPDQAFSLLNACTINGTWQLHVIDGAGGNVGTINNWSITFSGPPSYTWANSATLSSSSGATVTATPTVTTTYTLTGTSAAGCVGTKTVTVTVNPTPTMTSANSATICSGSAVNIPLTASTGSTFSWIATDNANTTGESTTAQSNNTINNTITLNGGITTPQTVSYTVTPTATSGGCIGATQNVTVTVNPKPTISAMSNIATGCVGSTVSVPNYTVTPASTINWSVSPSGSGLAASGTGDIGSFIASAAGTYTVSANATATTGGCSTSSPTVFTITINNKPTVASTSTTVCSGQSATITASGATTYTWSTSATGSGLTINPATTTTTYTVNGTNTATTCTNTATGTITVNALPNVAATSTTVCSGQSASLTASGATTYTWSTGATGSGLTINPATSSNTYTVTGTDGNGCTKTATGSVTVNPLPTISSTTNNQTVCSGTALNTITFNTSPATGVTINWTNNGVPGLGASGTGTTIPAFTPTVTVATTGTISATVTNNSTGCSSASTGLQGIITVNPKPTIASTSTTVCNGTSATISASGGNTYSWNTGASGSSLTINPATATTTYTVTGTNTATTCTNTATGTITVNALPSVAATSTTVCSGQNATLTASGATTYTWSTSATGSSLNVTNPPVGTNSYTVTGTDGNNCTNTATGTINVNPLPTVSSATSSQTVCAGLTVNAITFSTTPATGVTVSWSNSNLGIGLAGSGNGNITGWTSPNVASQQQGTITAVVTNTTTGCSNGAGTATGIITINPNPTVTTPATPTNPSSCGGSDGALNGLVVGGTAPITYSWNSGAYTGANISGLSAGGYNVVATDGNGCTVNASYSLTDPTTPTAPTFAISPGTICEGSSIFLNVMNPQPGETYNWYGPSGSLGTGDTIFINNATLANAGTYSVSTTAAGCTGNPSPSQTLTVNQNPTANITSNSLSICRDSQTVIDGSSSTGGGTATVTGYQWIGNGSVISGATSTTYTVNQAGSYQLAITNSNGCVDTSVVSNVIIFSEPDFSTTPPNSTNTSCVQPTGAIGDVTPASLSGGTSDYTYSWYGSSGLITSATSTSTSAPALTGQAAGSYTLIVVDNNGCNDTLTATIVDDNAPNAPALAGTNPANCSGSGNNPISMTSSGTLTWYSDAGLTNVIGFGSPFTPTSTQTDTLFVVDSLNGCSSSSTQIIITVINTPAEPSINSVSVCQGDPVPDLQAVYSGNGSVYWFSDPGLTNQVGSGLTFASGVTSGTVVFYAAAMDSVCSSQAVPAAVAINTPPTINTTNLLVDSASCDGTNNGNLTGISVGGTPSFVYVWANSTGVVDSIGTTPDLTNAAAGTYTLTVTDGNGCVTSQGPIEIYSYSTPNTPAIDVAASTTTYCDGDPIGSVTANSNNGNIIWYSDPALTNQIGVGSTITPTGISTDTVLYVVSNNNNCISASLQVPITFNPLPSVSGNDATACNGDQVTLNGAGATTYTWDNGVTDGVPFTPTSSGTYQVTGTDANGCVNTATVTVTVNALPNVSSASGAALSSCNDGTSTITLSGTGASTYTWDNGVTDGVPFVPTNGGNYVVTGTDANGCQNTFTVSVSLNNLPTVTVAAAIDSMPCGNSSYDIAAVTTDASSPTYQWTGPNVVANGNTASPTVGAAGNYVVLVTDGVTGCSASGSVTVADANVHASFTPDVTTGFTPLGVNFTNNSTGATSYTWTFGDGNTSTSVNPSNTYTLTGTFTVTLTAYSNGCQDDTTAVIVIDANSSIVIPNIFSPNGDGVNDILTITSTGIKDLNIDIFNRWGQKVYVITAPGQNWDGTLDNGNNASEGTYFYILKAIGYDQKEYEAQGPIMLVK